MITKGRAEQIKSELYKVFGKDIKIDVISAKDLVNLQADNTGKYAVVIASVIILLYAIDIFLSIEKSGWAL